MKTTQARIGVVAGCLGAGFCVVLLHLWFVMVHQHETWAQRSRDNRWAFRSVPSQRGSLLDRHGRVLAYDEPSMQLSVYYLRFRLRHPVGAAVHAATRWSELRGGEPVRYGYAATAAGPMAAVQSLLAMPAQVLRPGVLPKQDARDLTYAVTTVLSASTDLPRRRVYSALREAWSSPGVVATGDVLPLTRGEVLAGFARTLAALRRFDQELVALRTERLAERDPAAAPPEGLIARLDRLRQQSLDGARVTWVEEIDEGGEKRLVRHTGGLVEESRRVVDDHVPFEFAARLRVGAALHPGLEVYPSIRRVLLPSAGTALQVLVGEVKNLDRALPDEQWLRDLMERGLPPDWLDEFAPAALAGAGADREDLQAAAKAGYERALLRRERRGTLGLERTFDEPLMGRLGMRLVEHDRRRREQLLWSNLRVEPGEDVRLSLDIDLQEIAERLVDGAFRQTVAQHVDEQDRDKVRAAFAVLDARSGDVLAFAGAPVTSRYAASLPGATWPGNGSLGSVVKPIVLVEQLRREALGIEHRPMVSFDPCVGKYVFGNQRLGCGHAHGERGRDPVEAIADSCNSFFFQCAEGFGADGVAIALRRFGLCPPAGADDPFAVCWQPPVRGVPFARPSLSTNRAVPMRAVGYGVQATPLSVARAYAALATGVLPTIGFAAGAPRPLVRLDDVAAELEVVREGLRGCVEHGTAKDIRLLQHFGVRGKTGTAEVGEHEENNAWFAGYLPAASPDGVQLCFCAVVYFVPNGVHGDEAAGRLVANWLAEVEANPVLADRYLGRESGR